MSTITIRREATADQVVEALKAGLGTGYRVQPGTRIPEAAFTRDEPAPRECIAVSTGATDRVWRAQVTVVPRGGQTDIQIRPGGILGPRLVNSLGIARRVRQVLLEKLA